GKGTAEKPITMRAQTPGKVILTGASSVTIDGEHLVVNGLYLKDAKAPGDGVRVAGRQCRVTETAVVDCAYKFYVHLFGTENRVDHCYLAGKANDSPTLQVEVGDKPNRHQIDHNHFGHRPPLGRNGGETMRVGYSHQSMNSSGTLVEHNLFERCDGEIEIISSKSCDNVYRFNTYRECAGMLTLRHGNRCTVEANFFLGGHKRGSGGIRVIGDDHTIVNNYIDGVEQGAFWITSGIPDSPLKGYFRARNALVAFNTVVDSRGPYLHLDAGLGTSGRTLRPENITVVNNVFAVPDGGTLLKGTEGEGFRWLGNLASAGPDHKGIRRADLKLELAKDGLWRPAATSPVRGAAEGDFLAVKTDIDGQSRKGPVDAGCDQVSDGEVGNRPLTPADVGPSWLDRKPLDRR
ncbi:MAG TPA: polysaccharide lyase 6 family protein, partial [Gemmataceae bacterium]|nr:polysaccharide lyase 6 family protein [Gemmataceae bacterium]